MASRRPSRPGGFFQQVKKFFLSAFVVLTFLAYVIHEKVSQASAASQGSTGPNSTAVPTTSAQNVPGIPSSGQGATTAPTQTVAGTGTTYKDGTFTGSVEDAFYGQVQVQATIQGGKITNVQFLQYPNDRITSQEINAQAMPWLTQEAIQAQSANVNVITGATLTSQAFYYSLTTALQQAQQ